MDKEIQDQLRSQLKAQLKSERQVIIGTFRTDGMPEKLLRSLRQSVDAVLTAAWHHARLPANIVEIAMAIGTDISGARPNAV